jgi:hypothetical protein
MENNYKKYLKYKIKYLKLKNELKGGFFLPLVPIVASTVGRMAAKKGITQGLKYMAKKSSKDIMKKGKDIIKKSSKELMKKGKEYYNKMKKKIINKIMEKLKDNNICIKCKENKCEKCLDKKVLKDKIINIIIKLDFIEIFKSKDIYKTIKDKIIENLKKEFKNNSICSGCKNNICTQCNSLDELENIILDLDLETESESVSDPELDKLLK